MGDVSLVAWLFPTWWSYLVAGASFVLSICVTFLEKVPPYLWVPLPLISVLLSIFVVRVYLWLTPSPRSSNAAYRVQSPARLSILEFLEVANVQFGWDFEGPSMDPLDLEIGLRQAAADGAISFWGRKTQPSTPVTILDYFPLIRIQPEHFAEFQPFILSAAFCSSRSNAETSFDNCKTKTVSNIDNAVGYIDLHIGKDDAISWLEETANSFRGRTDAARISSLGRYS
jgi:hypothetical protein